MLRRDRDLRLSVDPIHFTLQACAAGRWIALDPPAAGTYDSRAMNTPIRLLLCALGAMTTASALATEPPRTGQVLILDNERTVEGSIERVGSDYRVHRAGGETWVPEGKVLRLCADMEDAYRFLHGRANLRDADELLRLARWCHGHGLPSHALECVSAAVQVNPNHVEAKRLLSGLQRIAATTPAPPGAHAEMPEPTAVPELNTEARAAFVNKVQPILMNACASCHAGNRGGAFKLVRGYEATSASRLSVQQNLAAVLAQVNLQQPTESKLLLKAVTAHDPQSREAPLNQKQMAAFHTLEDWVQTTLASNPHLREHATASAPAPTPPKPVPPPPAATGNFATGRPTPPQTTPVDEFDPLLFNRQGQAKQ